MTMFMPNQGLAQIVDAVRAQVTPELVLLFGSRAEGRAREDSDYDLMVVLRNGSDHELDRQRIWHALNDIGVAADVLVRSVSDYERRQSDPGFLDWLVARSGVLLYSSDTIPQRRDNSARVREHPSERILIWMDRAASDFRIAEQSMASTDPALDAICFHAHACVEKLLKALIVSSGTYPPRTHVLPQLLTRQDRKLREHSTLVSACKLLQSLYPLSRYPEQPKPTLDQAEGALESARAVSELVLPLLRRR